MQKTTTSPASSVAPSKESNATAQRRFLVIEDEQDLAELIRLHLSDLNASIELCHDGEQGLSQATEQSWNLIVLDLRLPKLDGLDVCRTLRANACDTPILMLTARSTELDRVLGLELGADDYLTKPFSPLELVARCKALLRRAERNVTPTVKTQSQTLQYGNLQLDREKRQLQIDHQAIELTQREFELLWFFAQRPGRVFSRAELLDQVWGYGHDGYEHTVNSHINRLRQKIETDPAHPQWILTVWGVGYKFCDTPAKEATA